jgi:hypothetical protein
MIDNLVLEDRRPQLSDRPRRFLEILEDLPLLPRILPCLLDHRLTQFLLRDFQLALLTDFPEHEAQTNAALCNLAVLLARGLFGLAFVFE